MPVSEQDEQTEVLQNESASEVQEVQEYHLVGELADWEDGFDLQTHLPKQIEADLVNFKTEPELIEALTGKTDAEKDAIIRANFEAMRHNNEELDKLNDRIMLFAGMTPEERRSIFEDEETSDSDKSILAVIKVLDGTVNEVNTAYQQNPEPVDAILGLADNIYGFAAVRARSWLREYGGRFTILTPQELETVEPGSVEDIASAALESFLQSNNFSDNRIVDFDSYLQGILIDCTRRTVAIDKDGNKYIKEEVDLEEFQDCVTESLSWAYLTEDDAFEKFSDTEYRKLQKRVAKGYADFQTGHHYRTDYEEYNGTVYVQGAQENQSIYGASEEDEEVFWKHFSERVHRQNQETFKYDQEVARYEMQEWADKLDLERIEQINDDEDLSYQEKAIRIAAYVQEVFGVKNPDDENEQRSIEVKWFRKKRGTIMKGIDKLFKKEVPHADLPESGFLGFYKDSERSINLLLPDDMPDKMLANSIETIVHELWHAKQHEDARNGRVNEYVISRKDRRARWYGKNSMAYYSAKDDPIGNFLTYDNYYGQMLEIEAHSLGKEIRRRLRSREEERIRESELSAFRKRGKVMLHRLRAFWADNF